MGFITSVIFLQSQALKFHISSLRERIELLKADLVSLVSFFK